MANAQSEHEDYRETREFETNIVQRLERIATALEKAANTAADDLEFRKGQAIAAAEEQRKMLEKLMTPPGAGAGFPTSPAPQRVRRGGGS